ncbi:hypothetical protein [Streptomyces hoynatensis]|uniref:Uncharacterized protein n=1 Tax=Streptomyces hoynatensis TaxID=1141874 RepID=A0A3A9YXV0_9ACTN|nr:hypothetical protein [Streptomyces hoynatensis]RKN40775.1 hypothetical protein D7294_16935 [Streptomyces hoynatensis]
MAGGGQWTIERICEALGNPTLSQRFLAEINRAPAHLLLQVFAKWQQIASDLRSAVERGEELAALEERGEDAPGTWVDRTEQVMAEAARIRSRGAA